MPKPAYPIAGDPIASAWGTQLLDYVGEHMRLVRNPLSNTFEINSVSGTGNYVLYELQQVPANDPTIFAVEVMPIFRCDAGAGQGQAVRLFDYQAVVPSSDANERCRVYWSGVAQRGGASGAVLVRVGGVNNRQIWYRADSCTGTGFWLTVYGWWVRDNA